MKGKDKDATKGKLQAGEGGDEDASSRAASLGEFFRFATRLDVALMLCGSSAALGLGAMQPLSMMAFGDLIDTLGTAGLAGSSDTAVEQIMPILLFFMQLGAAAFGAGFIGTYCFKVSGERQAAAYRKAYLRAIVRQDVAWHDTRSTTGLASDFADLTSRVEAGIGTKISEGLRFFGQAVGGVVVGFYFLWDVALIATAMAPVMALSAYALVKVNSRSARRVAQAFSTAGNACSEALGAIRTVASFSGEARAVERFDAHLEPAMREGIRAGVLKGFSFGMLDASGNATLSFAVLYASAVFVAERAASAARGEDCALARTCVYSSGRILLSTFAIVMAAQGVGLISQSVSSFTKARVAAGLMRQVMERKPAIDALESGGQKPPSALGRIEFRDVHFSYPAREHAPVYTGLSLLVEAGQTVALVGGSGSGKSTAIQLLERFYDVGAGSISLDGVDIRELSLPWLRSKLGLVGQEPALFEGSIEHNIAYGRRGASTAEVEAAARMANAHEFIAALPKGYGTRVRSGLLSGGQKQRVAIARALLKRPAVLLLDEATSALDNESERIVQAALDKLMAEHARTTIVIAHRLSTIRHADKIAVVGEGRVLEEGTHEQLLADAHSRYSVLAARAGGDASHGGAAGGGPRGGGARGGLIVPFPEPDAPASAAGPAAPAGVSGAQHVTVDIPAAAESGEAETKAEARARKQREQAEAKAKKAAKRKRAAEHRARVWELQRPERPHLALAIASATLLGATLPVIGVVFINIFFAFFEPDPARVLAQTRAWALAMLGLACATLTLHTARTYALGVVSEKLTRRLRSSTFASMLRQEMAWFDEPSNSASNLSANLSRDITMVAAITAESTGTLIANLATIVVGITLMFVLGTWQLALVAVLAVPVVGAALALEIMLIAGDGNSLDEKSPDVAGAEAEEGEDEAAAQKRKAAEAAASAKKSKVQSESHKEHAAAIVGQLAQSVRTVASFGLEETMVDEYGAATDAATHSRVVLGWVNAFANGLSQATLFFTLTALYFYGSVLISQGEATPSSMFIVIFVMFMMANGLGALTHGATDQGKAAKATARILGVLDRPSKLDPSAAGGTRPARARGAIAFEAVHFAYPARPTAPVYTGLSLRIEAGQTVALVGGSGSGKSTAIQLLERFYDVGAGSISLDGVDIRELSLPWLRSQLGLVGQEPVLFEGTVADNIAYSRPDASRDDVQQVARSANAHEFIAAFPHGYDTGVGQAGGQLSGGQKQRVAIARALLKRPAVLLLDEATSALDNESERIVQAALDKLMAEHARTTIVIAHRLSTIRHADKIAVVGEGRVLEEGTHEQLLRIGDDVDGHYAALVRASAR